jgi:hypothetical protein
MWRFFCILIIIESPKTFAQYESIAKNSFLGEDVQQAFDYHNISNPQLSFHSSLRPYLSRTYALLGDTFVPFNYYKFNNFFLSKTFNEKPEKRNWYNLQVHPIIDAQIGYDGLLKKPVFAAMGGLHAKLNINNDFTLAGTLVSGIQQLPFYLDTTFAKQKISSEFGQTYGTKNYAFTDFTGYVSYSPRQNKYFNFQLGRDKHFIGDGYRSLLLSDFAPAYPYFKINTNIWRLQYSAWYTWMYDILNANGIKNNFTNKFGTFHYLSYNIIKELNVAFFENVIWRGTDSNQVRTFDLNYLNPVIFLRPQEYSVGSPDNAFIGLNINGKLFKTLKLYGQLALDEFFLKEIRARRGWWANKQGWQLGGKYINVFKIKGLSVQVEYNQVRPYTYTHGLVQQNYAHYGLPLAHPYGANFREYNSTIALRKSNWQLSWQGLYAIVGKDSANANSNLGQNIFLSYVTRPYEYGHKTTQGIKTTILQSHFKFTYYLIPNMNLRAEVGYIQRSESNTENYKLQNPFVYFALRSSFWNSYKDY